MFMFELKKKGQKYLSKVWKSNLCDLWLVSLNFRLQCLVSLQMCLHLFNGSATLCVAQRDLLSSRGCQDLLDIPRVEVDVNQLVQVHLLVLPGRVQLLPLSKDGLDPGGDLTLGPP